MTPLRCLRKALSMTQGSRWHDDFDQPRRYVIDESGNQPGVRQGGDRLEGSHIDRHRRVRIGDRFGQEAFLADTKVARKPGRGALRGEQSRIGCGEERPDESPREGLLPPGQSSPAFPWSPTSLE